MSAGDVEGFAIDPTKVRAWKRYPAYKDSGVEWLGEVPAGWELVRLKYAVRMITQRTTDQNSNSNYIGLENIESWTGRLIAGEDALDPEGQSGSFESGDVLFGKLRPYLAKVHKATVDGICSTEILVLRPKLVSQDYLFYYLLNAEFIKTVNSSTYGTKMPRANWDFIGNLLIPDISLHDQSVIAAFLDRETARIDALIEKKHRFIELLEEKRQALISHAVMKGLDPDVEMKDSEVEWLGEVPVHWAIKRLKTISPRISGRLVYSPAQYFCENGVPFLFGTNVTEEGISLKDTKFIPHEVNERFKHHALREGDLVMVRVGAPGLTTVVPTEADGLNCASMMIIRRDLSFNSRWLAFALNSRIGKTQVDITTYGAAQVQINISDAVNFMIPTPPLDEQNRIVDYLDQRIFKISSIVSLINTNVERLQEYRTALISAAIIGKIDVRSKTEAT